ncbi:hypothetical protein COV19_04950 [Candidatus Woesearchaeota archaeon CG10_big_fil_rev_8_21_14_0_10_44_13]|nr:MAG: hypothetical protein COV19_04950 [Candidatus Woesearchaeota archaeon CG10_big_fil_rev_8_21_14_0_10_44_13]
MHPKPKRSQAAMEFLLTYGWAILVVLVVIGALAYFGVLNPAKLLPDKCYFGTFGKCDNFVISDRSFTAGSNQDMVWIVLLNNLDRPIGQIDTTISGDITSCNIIANAVAEGLTPGQVMAGVLDGTLDAVTDPRLKFLKPSDLTTNNICNLLPVDCTGVWAAGKPAIIVLANCDGINKGDRLKEQIDLVYAFAGASQFTHASGGEVSGIAVETR